MASRTKKSGRIPIPAPPDLSPLDLEILRQIRRHRFLRSDQVVRATRGSAWLVSRRLGILFRHGYLGRPGSQRFLAGPGRSGKRIYSLGRRGARHLRDLGEVDSARIHEGDSLAFHLEHTIAVAEFMIRLELDLPEGVALAYEDDGNSTQRSVASVSWTVPISYRGQALERRPVPDRVFRLTTRDETLVFCLELDRGTMPVFRSSPEKSSFYRKILEYHETWRTGVHVRDLGWRRFRVLTLTSSRERRDHLIRVCGEVVKTGGSGLFLFADQEAFSGAQSVTAMPWVTGDGLNVAKILSETRG